MEMASVSLFPFFFSFLLNVPVSICYERKAYYYHYFDFGSVPKYISWHLVTKTNMRIISNVRWYYERIMFQGYTLHWLSSFLMVQLK